MRLLFVISYLSFNFYNTPPPKLCSITEQVKTDPQKQKRKGVCHARWMESSGLTQWQQLSNFTDCDTSDRNLEGVNGLANGFESTAYSQLVRNKEHKTTTKSKTTPYFSIKTNKKESQKQPTSSQELGLTTISISGSQKPHIHANCAFPKTIRTVTKCCTNRLYHLP